MGELETEAEKSRAEIATYLQGLADQLDAGGDVTLELGAKAVTMNPTEPITFKLEGESDWSEGESEAKQLTFSHTKWTSARTPGHASAARPPTGVPNRVV